MFVYTKKVSIADGKEYLVFQDSDSLYSWLEVFACGRSYRIACFNGYENAITFEV